METKTIPTKLKIEDHTELIQKYARVALKKIRKPSIHNLEDLTQEGTYLFYYTKKRYRSDGSVTFKTYFIGCLIRHFTTIVCKSYKEIEAVPLETIEGVNLDYSIRNRKSHNPSNVANLLITLSEILSLPETEYIIFLLQPPEYITQQIRIAQRKFRILIREALGISPDREREIRRGLKVKLKRYQLI